jgi:hypothetical protein
MVGTAGATPRMRVVLRCAIVFVAGMTHSTAWSGLVEGGSQRDQDYDPRAEWINVALLRGVNAGARKRSTSFSVAGVYFMGE